MRIVLAFLLVFAIQFRPLFGQNLRGGSVPQLAVIQKNVYDTAYVKVYYEYKVRKDSLSDKKENGQTILLIGNNNVGFYDYYKLRANAVNDSVSLAKGTAMDAFAKLSGMMTNIKYRSPLVIDRRKNKVMVQLENVNVYQYEEPVPNIVWHYEDGDTTLCEVPCKKATCYFGGRKWTAWYAPSFSVNAGPYLFSGLQGLIFDISDTKDNFRFSLNGVENLQQPELIYLNSDKSIEHTTRDKARRAVENEQHYFVEALMMKAPGTRLPKSIQNGKLKSAYNPIELY